MKKLFFKFFLLIIVLLLSSGDLLAQVNWTKYPGNPVFTGQPGTWYAYVTMNSVLYNADSSRYEMWFTAGAQISFPYTIGFAWSEDGISWNVRSSNPVLSPTSGEWDAYTILAPYVIRENGQYKMWYTGCATAQLLYRIGYATSTDGINWTKHPSNPVFEPDTAIWESAAVSYPCIMPYSNGYKMWYGGYSANFSQTAIGYATSPDGINWERYASNPVLISGTSGQWDHLVFGPRVLEIDNTYYMFYSGEIIVWNSDKIGLATSSDGLAWTKYPSNPVLQPTPGQWDGSRTNLGSVLMDSDTLKMYYTGLSGSNMQLGLATSVFSPPLIPGTYTIGMGGKFATIQDAFNKLETDGVAGNVTLELIDELYTAPAVQFGFSLNGPIPGAGPNSRVTITPALNKNVTIEGNGESLLYLINTSYVTFDGVSITGSTTLTIHTLQNSAYVYNDALDFINNSDHNVIQNITFIVEDNSRASGSGFWFTQSGSAPDSNLIQNNFVKKAGAPFFIVSASTSLKGKDNAIRENQIGSETDSLCAFGIEVSRCENSIIENNIVQNLKATLTGTDQIQTGILSNMSSGTIIRNNIIGNLRSSSGYSTSGIFLGGLAGSSGSENLVYNNMIYDVQSTSAQNDSRVTGIEISYQTNPKIYYNSVYLSGIGTNKLGSAALYIGGGSTGVDSKNNILINTRDESPYPASSIYDYSAANLNSDYNDLYSNNYLVRIGGTNYNTLADWQAMGKDLNSLNESANFISSSDLHINNSYSTLLDGHATPIAGIETDFDGQMRSATTPDIGADEFDVDPNATIWQLQNSHFPSDVVVDDFSAPDNQVCWAVGLKLPLTPYAGYIRTIDGGNTWVCDTIPGLSNSYSQQVFAIDSDTAYVTVYKLIGTSGSKGIYKTTEAGATWVRQEAYNNSQSGAGYIHFFDAQNGLAIGDPNLETYTTTNGGLTWDPVTMPASLSNEYTAGRGDGIFAVGNTVWFSTGARLFKSTDRGYTWTILLSEPQYINWSGGIAFQDALTGIYSQKMVGSTSHQYRKTTDGGVTWEILSDPILDQIAATTTQHIPGTEKTYFIGGSSAVTMSGIAATYDGGDTWSMIDTVGSYQFFFPSSTVGWNSPYAIRNIYKYVGPRIISSVEEETIDLVPTGYTLSQNYPNPFNPSTTFRYSIPTQSKVVIKVYDILGNEIATLMDEEKPVGTYELTWNAANLPSGVYFYQLRAGDFIDTKKMILLK